MKTFRCSLRTGLHLAVLQLGLLQCPTLPAAVTFSITPATVSNTYNGAITLQVNGLTIAETVVVQKFLDLNTNGAIDASDWLVQQFKLTEGQAGMVIGGVTNFNVPGDTDTTSGQITARLNFRNGDFMQNIAGQYAFKLSSPGGHFAPITNLFTVTNFPYAQKLTGNVVSNGTSTTLPNATVFLFPPPRPGKSGPSGNPVAGTVANNSGSYTIPAPPGTYMPVAFSGNYLANFSTPPVLTLGSGATVTTNLTLSSGTASISGRLVDANSSNIGLAGILMSAQGANGLIGVGYTDTNGNFTLGAQSGQWSIKVNDTSLIIHGYLGLQGKTNVNAGATGVTIGCPKATSLVYGSVVDNLGNPLPGIDIYASDNNNSLYQTDGYTDASGNYVIGVVGDLGGNDPWWVSASSSGDPTNYLFSQPAFDQNGGTNISANTAAQANFTAILATNQLTGLVKDTSNHPISNVQVYASATINGVNYHAPNGTTDVNGYYTINVANGLWFVSVKCCCGTGALPSGFVCPNGQSVTINNGNGVVNFTVSSAPSQITGYVRDNLNNPISNVGVYARTDGGAYVSSGTDSSGHFTLFVANGAWYVGVACGGGPNSLDTQGYVCLNEQTVTVNNSVATVNFFSVTAPFQITGSLKNAGGNPISGVQIYANATINSIDFSAWVNTDANGNYVLQVANGTWNVSVNCCCGNNVLPSAYRCPDNQTVNINNTNGVANFTVQIGAYQISGTLTDNGYNPIAGVHLYASNGGSTNYLTAVTGTNGYYSFVVGSGNWDIIVDCSDLSPRGYACLSDQAVNISHSDYNGLDFMAQPCLALQITSVFLPGALVGAGYNFQLQAVGCSPSYSWSLTPGSLPLSPGLALSSTGNLTGIPTVVGTNYFSIRVTDSGGGTADELLQLNVYPPLQMSTNALPNGTVTFAYNAQITISGGHPGYYLYVSSGSFPAGLNIYPDAVTSSNQVFLISGTPTGSGTFGFTLEADDTDGNTVQRSYLITIAPSTLQITTTSLSHAVQGINYTYQLEATGGATPYTWSIALGSQPLPSGFNLSSNGIISGVASSSGSSTFIVRLTDHNSTTLTRSFTLTINPRPTLIVPRRFSVSQFQFGVSGVAGQNYTVQYGTSLTNWTSLFITNSATGTFTITDLNATNKARYYRLLLGP